MYTDHVCLYIIVFYFKACIQLASYTASYSYVANIYRLKYLIPTISTIPLRIRNEFFNKKLIFN